MRFGSMQMTRGWIEESGEFEEECKNNLQASIGRWKNKEYNLTPKLLQTCNPAKNYLYREYYKKAKNNKLEVHKKFIQALPSDNKMLPEDYISNLIKILSPNEIERLVNGNWEFDDNPYAINDYNKILDLFTNSFITPNNERYLSCDIAYEGSDLFVICYWEGFVIKRIYAIEKIDEILVSKKINDIRIDNQVPLSNVVYDADGLRKFVRNSSETGILSGANAFRNNGTPVKVDGFSENYGNLKAQCYFKLAEMIQAGLIYIEHQEFRKQIIEDLEQINKKPMADDRKIRLESKKDLKDRLGRSPDFSDAIMMRMWFELKTNDYEFAW